MNPSRVWNLLEGMNSVAPAAASPAVVVFPLAVCGAWANSGTGVAQIYQIAYERALEATSPGRFLRRFAPSMN